MKRFLMILLAPFTLVGGLFVGYYSYAIRVADQLDYTTIPNNYPLLFLGIVLIIIGYIVRHSLLKNYDATKAKLTTTCAENEALHHRMEWVEEVLSKAIKEEKEERLQQLALPTPPKDE